MARRNVVKFVPTSLEFYLSCELLNKDLTAIDCEYVTEVIYGFIRNVPRDVNMAFNVRKIWYRIITAGLSEEQIDELVNS